MISFLLAPFGRKFLENLILKFLEKLFLTKLIQTKHKTLCLDSLGFVWLEIKYYKSFSYNFILNFITIFREAVSLKNRKPAEASLRVRQAKQLGFRVGN